MQKICSRCKILKDLSQFNKCSKEKDGLMYSCKECIKISSKEYRVKHAEKLRLEHKKRYWSDPELYRSRGRKSKSIHKNKTVEYRTKNKDRIFKLKKEWYKKHKDNPIQKIKRNLRRRLHHALKDNYKSKSTLELLGCTLEFFKQYIESLFLIDMTWENYGPNGWHLDHKKPCHSFDLSNPEQQKLCFHYTNIRPLWAKDNLSRTKEDYKQYEILF